MALSLLFPTSIWTHKICAGRSKLNSNLRQECYQFETLDLPGKEWSQSRYLGGYTSYGSITNLHVLSPTFALLKSKIDQEVYAFARQLQMDFNGRSARRALHMNSLWINIMPFGVVHTGHIHPLSVISGTYYVQIPRGSSGLKFEDPRLGFYMNTPPRKEGAKPRNQWFVEIHSQAGSIVLFESWLRHEVPPNAVDEDRISVSFNYGWQD